MTVMSAENTTEGSPGLSPRLAGVGLAAALLYPSVALFKHLPVPALAAWLMVGGVAAAVWFRFGPGLVRRFFGPRFSLSGVLTAFVLLLGSVLVIHPAIDEAGFTIAGKHVGASDADDALEVAITEMLAGRYPYRARTFLDNPITPMPGAVFLAMPFYLLGNVALQNFFWLGLLFACLIRRGIGASGGLWLAVGLFGLCPSFTYQLLQGSDYLSNGCYVLVFSVALLESVRRKSSTAWTVLWSILLGVAYSSRLNFVMASPLVFIWLLNCGGWRKALLGVLPCAFACVALTLPFWLADPEGFSPLHTVNKLDPDGTRRGLAIAVAVVAGLASFGLGFLNRRASLPLWIAHGFVIQAFLLAANFFLGWLAFGSAPLAFAHFGSLALPFGLAAFAPRVFTQGEALPASGSAS